MWSCRFFKSYGPPLSGFSRKALALRALCTLDIDAFRQCYGPQRLRDRREPAPATSIFIPPNTPGFAIEPF